MKAFENLVNEQNWFNSKLLNVKVITEKRIKFFFQYESRNSHIKFLISFGLVKSMSNVSLFSENLGVKKWMGLFFYKISLDDKRSFCLQNFLSGCDATVLEYG